MYLKSLVLKGFKSFADRSALAMEPGITCVVGPNGSGKSNISDAVLWVLGERNAKHLRGASMEDVIFAGSTARKATGMAEVELVLDNADGKLPVDYAEVSITRRMYRTGESEYLINGSPARRMDVLDILHDSGLGTGTHSIISQGSLDSVLQSKPEDRRALIEEAAGVLKHKQRKAKSERKLAAMDATLARVRDVAGEVSRQLGPLERKAKKARRYQELSSQLTDVSLALAVDDLRTLRRAWDAACSREQQLVADLQVRHQAISTAEAAAEALQAKIRKQTENAGALSRSYQRASSALERFDGATLLLHEKRRSAQGFEADVRVQLESGAAKRAAAADERDQASAQLEAVRGQLQAAQAKVDELEEARKENAAARRNVESELDKLQRQRRDDERTAEADRRKLAQTQEALANGLAHAKLVEGRAKELELALSQAEQKAQKLSDDSRQAEAAASGAKESESAARAAVAAAMKARDDARGEVDAAHRDVATLESRIAALEELERASASAGPAREWVVEHARAEGLALSALSHAVRADEGYEALVETLLGADVAALMAEDGQVAAKLAIDLSSAGQAGSVVLLGGADMRPCGLARRVAASCGGQALLDVLSYEQADAAAVEALLGDVVVCDSIASALSARQACGQPVRFVTREGAIAWPSGKLSLGSQADAGQGTLARARQLDEARVELEAARAAHARAQEGEATAEDALREAQADSLQRSQKLAELRGAAQAAAAEAKRASDALASTRREFADVQRQREQADKTVAEARPTVERLEASLSELAAAAERRAVRIEELDAQVVPLRKEAAQLRDGLSEAKLSAATLRERETYTARIVDARGRDVAAVDAAEAELRANLARKLVAQQRIAPLLSAFDQLSASARLRTRQLEERAQAAQEDSEGLHSQVSAAREAAKAAHEAYDGVNADLSAARVEKGRLEVQVESAVNAIVEDMGTPLERALELPVLEDRGQAEQNAFALKRSIANMGAINPEAAAEYDEVKARHDYLAAQLADLDGARRSLEKIVRVIDARMKDDFVRTFAQVNDNFKTIFATLFPGGSAELALTDPEDLENTGVEVSAQPAGKRITKMMLMSGGEKSLTAIALLFAVYRIRSAPFYILDEVEAALDDSNLRRLTAYLQSIRGDTQLIMITHQRRTMEMADVLFGVSMQKDGVTKVISQKLDRALQYAE